MTRTDYLGAAALLALGVGLWVRDLSWLDAPAEAIPALCALPLFVWLGRPWMWMPPREPASDAVGVAAALCLLVGSAVSVTLLLALGWTLLLWRWLCPRLEPACAARVRSLLVLPVLAFPWVAAEGRVVGWWFRLTAAWTVEDLFCLLGWDVARSGTALEVGGVSVSVEAACSGLGCLQAMLVAGVVLASIELGSGRRYWAALAALAPLAWFANTLRVAAITVAAVAGGAEFARGFFHDWGGWLLLVLMFLLCRAAFALLGRVPTPRALRHDPVRV
jgi:exosortase